jgi:type IV pilus assembly protein PilW
VFIYGSRNYKQDDKIARMQDELRFAMARITQDLEMTAFFAQVRQPVSDIGVHSSATISNDCGPTTDAGAASAANNWTYQERRSFIYTAGNVPANEADNTFPCISDDEFQGGTDIVASKRLGSIVTAPQNNQVYLRTNGIDSTIYVHSATPPPPTGSSVTIYEYRPVVWYISKYAVSGQSPQVPSLCRKVLDPNAGSPRFIRECVSQGIQDMQLEFGIDSASDPDGIADQFVEIGTVPGANPAERAAYMARIVAVRVHLLARSAEADVTYRNAKTFTLAGKSIPATNDGYYRRTLSSIALLRNAASRLNPFALPNS